jgi:hypothetical protein
MNSQTKMFDSKDFKKYIMNIEKYITKVSNYYNYLIEKYDKKINNIVNRYEGRTNNLYIDLRRREGDYMKLSKKIDNIINKTYDNCYIDTKDIDYTYRIISLFLYMYTLFVIMIVISYFY